METVRLDSQLGTLLAWCEENEASDLHCQANDPFCVRIHGSISRIPEDLLPLMTTQDIYLALRETFSEKLCERVENSFEHDVSFQFQANRYRANFSKQRGEQSFSFRIVPQQEWNLRDLQLPASLRKLLDQPRGLILLTGPTGQGKSTSIRALLQELNQTTALRVITIEDPIEFVFTNNLCQFEQREVGIDTATFANGIRNAMRQDPDVIFLGEMRDRDSVWAAMQACETGHLVLSTLHADSASQAISRIRELYPAEERDNICGLLARNMRAIINQRLLPNVMGTRTPCIEVLLHGPGVQQAITENNLVLLSGIIEASVNQGMHTFDQYLIQLTAEGVVSEETALAYAFNRHKFELTRSGIVTGQRILKQNR